MGQRPDAGDVSDRPQPLADAQVRVDRDPVRVGLDADGLQTDPLDPRPPAGRDEQPVAAQLAASRASGRSRHRRAALPSTWAPRMSSMPSGAAPRRARRRAARPRERARARPLDDDTSAPKRWMACASSTPAAPPPSTSRRRGNVLHAGRLPGAPDALELAQAADRRHERIGSGRDDDVSRGVAHAVDLDDPDPASRPLPRIRSMPRVVSHFSCPASDQLETMKSRQASAASTSTSAVAAASRAPCTASPGRSSVLDGMHAQ